MSDCSDGLLLGASLEGKYTNHASNKMPCAVTDDVAAASDWLANGALLAYPTESVWGLGVDAVNARALAQLLLLKNRPANKGLIVLTDNATRLLPLIAHLPPPDQQIIITNLHKTTSRPHTWLLPIRRVDFSPLLIGAHSTLAVRIIQHPVIAELCANSVSAHNPCGFLVSTSCNLNGAPPAQNLAQAMAYFGNQVGYLQGDTMGFAAPSVIKNALTGDIARC